MSEPVGPIQERAPGTGIVVLCFDGANGERARAAATVDHLKYVEAILHEINVAGPLFDPSGMQTIGSLYVLQTTDETEARQIVENDPYFKAGAFAEVRYQRFLPAAGHYIGGKIW
ncbi:MAG: YciI family protein [Proteobacteria bacterium]|nr:YciI family protein [Pseudomonadota bacterium]